MLFFIGCFAWAKKLFFSANQEFSIYRKLTNRSQKLLVFSTKTPLVWTIFYCPQKLPFHVQKTFFCTSRSWLVSKTAHFYKPKVFLLHKPFLLPPKAILFHPPPPIRTTLNLLFAKNTAILLISALTPCAVKPERRTDSNHCRRYPVKLQLFAKPVTWWLPVIFAKTPYRPAIWNVPGVQRFANLWCTFGSFRTREKNKPVPFRRKLRGSANLESAHRSDIFAAQQLKPF